MIKPIQRFYEGIRSEETKKPYEYAGILIGLSIGSFLGFILISPLVFADHPNIILIYTDDLANREFNQILKHDLMPNFVDMFGSSTNFTNSFVTNPICCPSRATLLSGQYSQNTGVYSNRDLEFFNDAVTIATVLNDTGYNNYFIGKYLNGFNVKKISRNYIPPGWDEWVLTTASPRHTFLVNYTIVDNLKVTENVPTYRTLKHQEFVVDQLAQAEEPFFLYYSPIIPHHSADIPTCDAPRIDGTNLEGHITLSLPETYDIVENLTIPKPNSYNSDTSDQAPWNFTTFLPEADDCFDYVSKSRMASMITIDDIIGDIQSGLDDRGFTNNIFIFTSDNGMLIGEHNDFIKGSPFEEAIKVPLYITGKDQSISKFVLNNDLAPTIAEMAGTTMPNADGLSLLPLINDDTIPWRDQFYVTGSLGVKVNLRAFEMLRTQTESYIEPFFAPPHLYNLENDPYQLDNIYSDCTSLECKAKVAYYSEMISQLSECKGLQCTDLENRNLDFPPRKQIQLNQLPENVYCNKSLELIIKQSDGSPACVKPTSVQKLIARGWAS